MRSSFISKLKLAGGMLLTCSSLFGAQTNKTYFSTRPQTSYNAARQSAWTSQSNKENPGFGGTLQLAPFYQQSADASGLGKYFGFANKRNFVIGNPANGADIHAWNFNLDLGQVDNISFSPKSITYGVRLDYKQDLYHILEGLSFTVDAPIVRVENNMHLGENMTQNTGNWWNTAKAVFAGGRLSSDWSEPFKFAKIAGARSATGLADVDLGLNYRFLNRDRYMAEAQLNLTVPTGNKASAEYMFEPIVGNGCHWAVGAGLSGRWNVWQHDDNEDRRLSFWLHARLDYLFENDEVRTLGLKGKNWGQFIRMRQVDPANTANVLANSLPGVNVMSRAVNVTPGVQFNGLLSGDYTHNAWKIGLGYNIWAREAEHVKLKGAWETPGTFGLAANDAVLTVDAGIPPGARTTDPTTQQTFIQNSFVVHPVAAGVQAPTGAAFQLGAAHDLTLPATLLRAPLAQAISSSTAINGFANATGMPVGAPAPAAGAGATIASGDVDLSGHPAVVSHKFALSVAYALNTDHPSYVGAGAAYEFGGGNAVMDNWMAWVKFGVSF